MIDMKQHLLRVLFAVSALAACQPVADTNSTLPATAPNTVVISRPPTTTTTPPAPTVDPWTLIDWSALRDAMAQHDPVYIDAQRAKHGRCGEWHDLAIEVGWPEETWKWLQGTMYRESRCTATAWNGHDAGLTQINQVHKKRLNEWGLKHPDSMFNPRHNLEYALFLYKMSGCAPWRFSNSC